MKLSDDSPGPSVRGFKVLAKTQPDQSYKTFGDESTPWFIAQWNNPNDLRGGVPADSWCGSQAEISVANGTSRVCLLPGSGGTPYRLELAQNGDGLPCADPKDPDVSAKAEFDLFISQFPYGGPKSGHRLSPRFDTLQSLMFSFALQIPYGLLQPRCTQSVWYDQMGAVASLVFGNTSGQTLFYQIVINQSNAANGNFCNPADHVLWFYNPQPGNPKVFGANEDISAYGFGCQKTFAPRVSYMINVLPNIKRLIAGNPKLDQDLSHWWSGGGYYVGNIGYGGFVYTTVWDSMGHWAVTNGPMNQAAFISQGVPAVVAAGKKFTASLTFKNTGLSTWAKGAGPYALGSQNPQDNGRWGRGRVALDDLDSIQPGQSKTFSFEATAPSAPGSYDFQWRMVEDGVEWFGDFSPPLKVVVDGSAPAVSITTPAARSTVNGTISIQASASDANGISKVEFFVDGALKGQDSSAPYAFTWDSRTVPDGSHSLSAKAYDGAGNSSQASISVSVKNGSAPKGVHDASNCTSIMGWACDPDDYGKALMVHLYADGKFAGAVTANVPREPAVGAQCGGKSQHGFSFTTPESLKDGRPHDVYAYAINTGPARPNPLLSGSPRSLTCAPSPAGTPKGVFEGANCTAATGWACDPDDYGKSVQVHFYTNAGGTGPLQFVSAAAANLPREAAVGGQCGGKTQHGFSLTLPDSLKDGLPHTLYAYAINIGSGTNPRLAGSPAVVTCAPPPAGTPKGALESADCSAAAGWACDPDDYGKALRVQFFTNQGSTGPLAFVGAATADISRGAPVPGSCGGKPRHGFSFPTPASLKDGKAHTLYAYAVNIGATGSNPRLAGSPQALSCASGPSMMAAAEAGPASNDAQAAADFSPMDDWSYGLGDPAAGEAGSDEAPDLELPASFEGEFDPELIVEAGAFPPSGAVEGQAYSGTDFKAYNFPNPFNLESKTPAQANKQGGAQDLTTTGTVIKLAVPAGAGGSGEIRIYTLDGDLVRALDLGELSGGKYYYLEWDGFNRLGSRVANGAYYAVVSVGGSKKAVFKPAVVK
jgi:hypothetical protein